MYTSKVRFNVNGDQLGEHEKKLFHRLAAAGMRDEGFLKQFFGRHEVERDLKTEEDYGPASYEEALDTWVGTAESDYEAYWLGRPKGIQEGEIKPKKSRRTRNPKNVAGAWERQVTLGRYLKEVASEDREIVRFRERAMSGRLLSKEEALAFLSSPLLADQPLHVLVNRGINLLEENHLLEEETDERGSYRRLAIKGRKPWRARPLAAKGPELVFPGDFVTFQDLRGLRAVHAITFSHPREEDQLIIARERSVIAELYRLTEDRLVGYPISAERGVWFVLTGDFNPQYPVRIHYVSYGQSEFSRTTFTLEVEGWLPPEEVLEQYRYAQSQVLGKTPRSPKRKNLRVIEFVTHHKGKSWGELFELWNGQHPNERFKDRSHLWTSYMRTLDSHLAAPDHAS